VRVGVGKGLCEWCLWLWVWVMVCGCGCGCGCMGVGKGVCEGVCLCGSGIVYCV